MAKRTPENEDWIQKKWRPMMAIMYMVVCIFDFIVFPIMFTVVQFWETQSANDAFRQWQPLTLVGAGLFHMAMGAVLGITAWSRGQEKIAGVSSIGNYGQPSMQGNNWNSSPNQQFGSTPTYSGQSYNRESSYETMTPIVSGYKGKKAPVPSEEPIL